MITKIGNALLEKDAFLGAIARGAGNIAKGAWSGLKGLGQLAEGAVSTGAKGLTNAQNLNAAAKATSVGPHLPGMAAPAKVNTLTETLGAARHGMESAWGKMSKGQKAWTAGIGGVGMGMLAGGDNSAPAPQYNFYQSGYPQQFSGSWQ